MPRSRADVWIVLVLLACAWAVRLLFASHLVFPPLDDPAFYVQTARNLAAGRGLVSDVLWSYQFPFPQVAHPSHEYWMPLATLLMAPWIRALGDGQLVAQLSGTLCGALLVPLTYALGRMVEPTDRRKALLAAGLVLFGALPIYQSASTDSAAPFALAAAAALIAGARAAETGSWRWAVGAGLLAGSAYLARSDGLLLPPLLAGMLVARRRGWILAGLLLAAFALPVVPWWLRNLAAFGITQPVSPLIGAALQDYPQLFNWRDPPTLAGLMGRGAAFAAALRGQALIHNLGVWALIAFPYGVFGWLGCLDRRRTVLWLGLAYALLLALTTALVFSVPTLAGLFYHSAGALLPWLAVGSVQVVAALAARRASLGLALAALTAALVVAQGVIALPAAVRDARLNQAKFARAATWLGEHARPDEPVIASQAHSLNYTSGRPSLSLPAGQGLESLRDLACAYRARYVVLTESFGRYPDVLDERLGLEVLLRLDEPGLRIYELMAMP
jgi:hypothetical protein